MKKYASGDVSKSCNPISANCVLWPAGQDLCCITVCDDDRITDIIKKLAAKTCNLEEQLDLEDLDISCLTNIPETEKTLINVLTLIIAKACAASSPDGGTVAPAEEAELTVASGLRYNDINGDPITELSLSEYTTLIGSELSGLKSDHQELETSVSSLSTKLEQTIETIPAAVTLPQLNAPEVMPDNALYGTEEVLDALVEQFDALRTATGDATALGAAVDAEPAGLGAEDRLGAAGTMSGIAGWVDSPTKLADSVKNLWLTILDIRAAVSTLNTRTAPSCSDILLDFAVALSNTGKTVNLYFSGYCTIPDDFTNGTPSSKVIIKDINGNLLSTNIDLATLAGSPDPVVINLEGSPVNTASDYTVILEANLTNGTIECEKAVIKTVANSYNRCPQVTAVPGITDIAYILQLPVTGDISYIVSLYNASDVLVTSTTFDQPATSIVNGQFTGLTADTDYTIIVAINLNGELIETCTEVAVSTQPSA